MDRQISTYPYLRCSPAFCPVKTAKEAQEPENKPDEQKCWWVWSVLQAHKIKVSLMIRRALDVALHNQAHPFFQLGFLSVLRGLAFAGKCGKSWLKKIRQAILDASVKAAVRGSLPFWVCLPRWESCTCAPIHILSRSTLQSDPEHSLCLSLPLKRCQYPKADPPPFISSCHLLIAADILHVKHLHKEPATRWSYQTQRLCTKRSLQKHSLLLLHLIKEPDLHTQQMGCSYFTGRSYFPLGGKRPHRATGKNLSEVSARIFFYPKFSWDEEALDRRIKSSAILVNN